MYGVNPKAVVTSPEVKLSVPPRVSEPLDVTVPLRVNPLTVPVPLTEVVLGNDAKTIRVCGTPLIVT